MAFDVEREKESLRDLISRAESAVVEAYGEIGERYASGGGEPDPELEALVAKVRESKEKIEEAKKKLEQLENGPKCPVCGAALEPDAMFCTTCGAKIGRPRKRPRTTHRLLMKLPRRNR